MDGLNALTLADYLSFDSLDQRFNFTDYFRDAGGSNAVNVDGSVTPVTFKVVPPSGFNIAISGVRIIFHTGQGNLGGLEVRRFGAAGGQDGLTNGVLVELVRKGITIDFFATAGGLKSMWQFFEFGSPTNIVGGIDATTDLLIWTLNFARPIALRPARGDELRFTVRDDLTPIDLLQIRHFGWIEED